MRAPWLLLLLAGCGAAPAARPSPRPKPAVAKKPAPAPAPVPAPPPAASHPLAPAHTVAAGDLFSCAIRRSPAGVVACWGDNQLGQLGDGTTQRKGGRVDVQGLDPAEEIGAWGQGACARTARGVSCWGAFANGGAPVLVAGLSSPRRITIGQGRGCAIESDSTVRCWEQVELAAQIVAGAEEVVGVSVGASQSCARDRSGRVLCWAPGEAAVVVPEVDAVVEIAASPGETCARREDGSVWCWGSEPPKPLSYAVPRAHGLVLGGFWGCVADEVGALRCWSGPVPEQGYQEQIVMHDRVLGAAEVVAGQNHLCARLASGELFCWGANEEGQIGAPGAVAATAQPVPDIDDAVALAIGRESCVVRKGGTAHCWPASKEQGFLASSEVRDLAKASAIAPGEEHSCAVVAGQGVACWGSSYFGATGDGPPPARTGTMSLFLSGYFVARVKGIAGARDVAVTRASSCAVAGGGVRCWGDSGLVPAELAGSSDYDWPCSSFGSDAARCSGYKQPRAVPGLAGVKELVAGGEHYCALTTAGAVWCWDKAVLGYGNLPQQVQLPAAAQALGAGGERTCAAVGSEVWCWFGASVDASPLTTAPGRVASVAVSPMHTCVAVDSGDVHCTGEGERGQLGDGKRESVYDAWVKVAGVADVVEVAAGAEHSCARDKHGRVHCWGAPPELTASKDGTTFSHEPRLVSGL